MLTIMTALCMMAAPVCGAVSEVMQTAVVAHAAGSGECGENVTWTLDDTGTLTISGTGEMDRGPYWVNPLSARAKPRRSQTISDTPRPAFPDAGCFLRTLVLVSNTLNTQKRTVEPQQIHKIF